MFRVLTTSTIFAVAVAVVTASLAHDITSTAPANTASAAAGAFVAPPLPDGPEGALIAYGKHIIQSTHEYAGAYAVATMSCEACHIAAGTKAHGGSLVGAYARFPQYNARAKRFITLQDRLAECFLYSMNGVTPPFASREMVALTAYIAYLSRGTVVGTGAPDQGLIAFKPPHAPSVSNGSTVYTASCAACHGADGSGGSAFPPLWGAGSFNNGAGMHRLTTMAAFVRYNMPYGSPPNTLSAQQAYDVSAFVLSHPRPAFDGQRLIAFPARKASFY
jgi:thiosulfate dehydrogenase